MKSGIGIFNLLSNNGDVTSLVSNRIFPAITSKAAALPFVTYDFINITPNDTKTGPSKLDEIDVEIVCHAETFTAASRLGDYVRAALDRKNVVTSSVTIDSIQFQSGDVEVTDTPRKFMVVLEFKVRQRMN